MTRLDRSGAVVRLEFEAEELDVLRELLGQVADELADAEPPGDPAAATPSAVRARLLPDGHRTDPALAAEHRELTEDSIREQKLADSAEVLAALPLTAGAVELAEPEPWLRALNDVRLMLGVQLAVTEEMEPPERVTTPEELRLAVYYWLTWLQESLLGPLTAGDGQRSAG